MHNTSLCYIRKKSWNKTSLWNGFLKINCIILMLEDSKWFKYQWLRIKIYNACMFYNLKLKIISR